MARDPATVRDMGRLLGLWTGDLPNANEPQAGTVARGTPPPTATAPRDPFARPDLDDDAPRRVGLQLAQLDGTPPQQVDQAISQMRSQGAAPQEMTNKFVEGARQSAVQENARLRAEARQKYADAMERAKAEEQAESRTQMIFRAIGDIASAAQGGPTNPVTDRVTTQRATQRKQSEAAAGRTLDLDMGELDARRQDESDLQKGTLYDQGQELYAQGRAGNAMRARGLADELRRAKINFPQELVDRDPEGFLAEFGPRFKSAMDRVGAVEDRESGEASREYIAELGLLDNGRGRNDAATANQQGASFQRAQKVDKVVRQQLQALDRALDVRISGVKDIELLYNFIARMDNTAAREGELALAQRAQDLMGRIKTFVGNLTEGQLIDTKLADQIREQLQITRQQLQDDRELELGGVSEVGKALQWHPEVIRQIDRMRGYGEQSTVPQAGGPAPQQQLEQLPTAAGPAAAPQRDLSGATREGALAERERRRRLRGVQ